VLLEWAEFVTGRASGDPSPGIFCRPSSSAIRVTIRQVLSPSNFQALFFKRPAQTGPLRAARLPVQSIM
jgi:hypothetical protein